MWVLYVLRCGDGSLYCGITNDPDRRLEQHRAGTGARYTRGRSPLELARQWTCADRSAALKNEAAFKRLSRASKLRKLASADVGPPFHKKATSPSPGLGSKPLRAAKQHSAQVDPDRAGRRSPGKIS